MIRRRLVPVALVVTGLLAVVAVAARGKPLSAGGGGSGGLTSTFWSYAFTTLLIIALLAFVGTVWLLWILRPDVGERKVGPGGTVRALAVLLTTCAVVFVIGLHYANRHAIPPGLKISPHAVPKDGSRQRSARKHAGKQATDFQWSELIVVLVLLAGVGAAYVVRRKRLGSGDPLRRSRAAPEAIAVALDDSLDDLLAEPDLRRAIVAAYARMEHALAATGLPRRPAEAPLEYLERALLSLHASAEASRRLTDLFEWARFSDHEPEPRMRDEAVEALEAVRDELRAAEPAPA